MEQFHIVKKKKKKRQRGGGVGGNVTHFLMHLQLLSDREMRSLRGGAGGEGLITFGCT